MVCDRRGAGTDVDITEDTASCFWIKGVLGTGSGRRPEPSPTNARIHRAYIAHTTRIQRARARASARARGRAGARVRARTSRARASARTRTRARVWLGIRLRFGSELRLGLGLGPVFHKCCNDVSLQTRNIPKATQHQEQKSNKKLTNAKQHQELNNWFYLHFGEEGGAGERNYLFYLHLAKKTRAEQMCAHTQIILFTAQNEPDKNAPATNVRSRQ